MRVDSKKRLLTLIISAAMTTPVWAIDLLGAYRLAVANDPNFLSAQTDLSAAEAGTRYAIGGMLPSAAVNSSRFHSELDQTYSTILGPRANSTTYLSKSDSISIRQPVLHYERYAQYRQAQAQEASADASVAAERQNMALRVSGAYVDVLAARDTRAMVEAQKLAYAGQLKLAERALANGTGARTDVDEAKARHDLILAAEIDANNQIANANRLLTEIIGESISVDALSGLREGVLPVMADDSLEEWTERVMSNNAALRSAEQQLKAAEYEVVKARAGHLPTVDLVAAKVRSESDTTTTIGQIQETRQIGVQVTIPLFSGGQTSAAVDQANARAERARHQLEATRRKLATQVGRAYDQGMHGRAKVAANEVALRSAQQATISTQKGLQAGTRNNVDVLNAQQQESVAKRDLARARYDYVISQINLQVMAGIPAEDVLTTINPFFIAR